MKKTTLLLPRLLSRRAALWAVVGLLAALAFVAPSARGAVTEAWVQRSDGSRKGRERAQAVAVGSTGNVVVTGCSVGECYTAKYAAADGAVLWSQRYNGPTMNTDYTCAVTVDGNGNVLMTESSNRTNSLPDSYTAKYAAADGAVLWEQRNNGPEGDYYRARAVAVDSIGNVVVTGTTTTIKYAGADGALLWKQRGPIHGAQAMAVDRIGDVVVTGYPTTVKYAAADGALLWEKPFPRGCGYAVAVDGTGNVVVTGTSNQEGWNNGDDYYTAKYAGTDGALLWEHRYNGPTMNTDAANAVALDGSGNVVVTGDSWGGGNFGTKSYTAKYAAADGALLWEKRYPGAEPFPFASANAVAVDSTGNAVVTGNVDMMGAPPGSGYHPVYYTAKYAAADGTLLWEKRYNGPANGNDYAHSLALGPNGMVAVTGSSSGSSGTSDHVTVVYRELPAPVSFADWAAGFGLTGAVAAADANPDSDSLPNGAEYILGGNPTMPTTLERPTATASGGTMIFTFPRDDGSETPDVTMTVETGTDLMTWSTVFTIGPTTAASSPGVNVAENGTAADTITVTIPRSADRARFARLKVTISS